MTLDELKDRLRKRLIEHDGNVSPHHLTDLIEEAKTIGLEEKDIARLVPDVDQSINWAAIKEEKRLVVEVKQLKEQEKLQAAELLDALISYSFSDGIVAQSELETIFARTAELHQSELKIAKKINKAFEKGGYKPYPNPDLKAMGLKEILLSTSWYDAKNYAVVTQQEPQKVIPPETVKSPARIHSFKADKAMIRKGESVVISWDVSGVEKINISGLGQTKLLQGKHTVSPAIDTVYVLTADDVKQSLSITIKQSSGKIKWIIVIIIIITILYALQ